MRSKLPPPLPVDRWPSLDQAKWRQALVADPLSDDGGGGGADWRESTRGLIESKYGAWLSWLLEKGELREDASPASRATRPQVRNYLDALERESLSDYSRASRLQCLADALRVMEPQADTTFIGRAASRISRTAKRTRDVRSRLRSPREVLSVGLDLMHLAQGEGNLSAEQRALLFRDGLLIALWVYRPLRIANLGTIQLGKNLSRRGRGYQLEFGSAEMKAVRPFSCTWPKALLPALAEYLETHRPALLSQSEAIREEKALWIAHHGGRLKQASVGQMIKLRTKAALGEGLNPHLMRYMVATTMAEREPEHRSDIATMLGHASLETSEHHYILAGTISAATTFQEAITSRAKPRMLSSEHKRMPRCRQSGTQTEFNF